jgi:uncharacterized protein YggT (Ycf19 family)
LTVGIVEVLLAVRLVLRLTGANPDTGFAQLIYTVTYPFVIPFAGLFGPAAAGASAFEVSTLVAMVISLLEGWLIVKVISLLLSDTRRGYSSTSRSTHTRIR